MWGLSGLGKERLASQEGLCCMEWSEVEALPAGHLRIYVTTLTMVRVTNPDSTLVTAHCCHADEQHSSVHRHVPCDPKDCSALSEQWKRSALLTFSCLANAGNFTFFLTAISAVWKRLCLEKQFYNAKHHVTSWHINLLAPELLFF